MPKFKDFKTIDEIAKKHKVSVDFLKKQLDFGINIEKEHTKNDNVAKTIALQHLDEFPDYYSHLKSLEHTAKTDNKLNQLENRVLKNICNIINERSNPSFDIGKKKTTGIRSITKTGADQLGGKAPELHKKAREKVDLPKLRESVRLPNKMGNLYNVSLNWRGKYLEVNVFFPQLRMPKKSEVQYEIGKIYPDARVITYIPSDRYTSNTFIYVNEEFINESNDTSNLKCNEPKASPIGDSKTGKSHVVKACSNGVEKTIRFGQRGVKGSPEKDGESEEYKNRRDRFKARHSKNIKKGKMSAAFWANKVKW